MLHFLLERKKLATGIFVSTEGVYGFDVFFWVNMTPALFVLDHLDFMFLIRHQTSGTVNTMLFFFHLVHDVIFNGGGFAKYGRGSWPCFLTDVTMRERKWVANRNFESVPIPSMRLLCLPTFG